jgi:hypothetical protein
MKRPGDGCRVTGDGERMKEKDEKTGFRGSDFGIRKNFGTKDGTTNRHESKDYFHE